MDVSSLGPFAAYGGLSLLIIGLLIWLLKNERSDRKAAEAKTLAMAEQVIPLAEALRKWLEK